MEEHIHHKSGIQLAIFVLTVIALILAGFVAYQYRLLSTDFESERKQNLELNAQLEIVMGEKLNLSETSKYQRTVIDSFQAQIVSLGGTVEILEKLSQTDPELLKKYSKVFFLNENYIPAKLTDIEKGYVYNGTTNFLIHTEVWPFLKKLLDDAHASSIDLLVASAFRSFDIQASLKSEYKVIYGAGTANQFSADQGYSEHQLGTSVDFTTTNSGGVSSNFQADPAYQWLKDNAHKYGFILSYPAGNSYYKFEPWHWRFVGVDLATFLYKEGKHFYDLD